MMCTGTVVSVVSRMLQMHPQTLRMYEREGLLQPARTRGNTRLYDADTIERLEIILALTRDLGVNLAGVEVILHMKERMEKMQGDWAAVSMVRDGMPFPKDDAQSFFRTVKGDKYTVFHFSEVVNQGTFTIDARRTATNPGNSRRSPCMKPLNTPP